MYTLAVARTFTAKHFLIGGDWGPENELHSHEYTLEVRLHGKRLNQHGYLVDIVQFESILEALLDRYREQRLNELEEFEGLNPSIENFASILCRTIGAHLQAMNLDGLEVRIWEDDVAWASYRRDL